MIQEYKELFSLKGKHAVVTGGAQGMGRCIAEGFLCAGAVVTLVDINPETVAATAAELKAEGGEVYSLVCDVTDEAQVAKMVTDAAELMGGLEIMMAVAGITHRAPAEEMSYAEWQDVINVNLNGVFLCDREAGKYMLAHKGGSIINMSSIIGKIANTTGNASYAASKAGVDAMTRIMAIEWAKRGVRVNCIAPAQVSTKFIEKLMADDPSKRTYFETHIPMGRLAKPQEMVSTAVYLASDSTSFLTGQTIYVDGGVTVAY